MSANNLTFIDNKYNNYNISFFFHFFSSFFLYKSHLVMYFILSLVGLVGSYTIVAPEKEIGVIFFLDLKGYKIEMNGLIAFYLFHSVARDTFDTGQVLILAMVKW